MFSFNKTHASEMGLRVLNDVVFESPKRAKNITIISGRNGRLIKDDNRYDDVIRSIPCRLEAGRHNVETMTAKISDWLGVADYHEFLWDNDADFVYRATVSNPASTHRKLEKMAETVIDFQLYPIKYLRTSMVERKIDNERTLVNSLKMAANPRIRIVGTGLVRLTIGLNIMEINIPADSGGCIIDSETMMITNLNETQALFRNTSGVFPTLVAGNNRVSWESTNDVQVFITPRLGALV